MHLTSTFFRGLGVVLPIALTVYLVVWAARAAETLLKPIALLVMTEAAYIPGSGVALALVLIYLAGLLVQLVFVRWAVGLGQRILERTPLVKSIYNALNDFVSYVSRRPSEDASRVVSVQLAPDVTAVGFVTDPNPTSLQPPGQASERVAVYLPMSYQVGGYTLLLPRSRLRPLALGVEDAMRLVLTAGVAVRSDMNTDGVKRPTAGA